MFITNAGVYYHNFYFRTKMALLLLGRNNIIPAWRLCMPDQSGAGLLWVRTWDIRLPGWEIRSTRNSLDVLQSPRCATVGGFSVHADVCIPAHDRMRLERLCRYAARPAVATERPALANRGCEAFGSDLRIQTPGGLFTYPDLSIVCGTPLLIQGRPDTLTNPLALIEVLSDATREYDRGQKFTLYKEIPTLREYALIEQDEVLVEIFRPLSERLDIAKLSASRRDCRVAIARPCASAPGNLPAGVPRLSMMTGQRCSRLIDIVPEFRNC
jgi:putative restriction endonuclease